MALLPTLSSVLVRVQRYLTIERYLKDLCRVPVEFVKHPFLDPGLTVQDLVNQQGEGINGLWILFLQKTPLDPTTESKSLRRLNTREDGAVFVVTIDALRP